MTTTAQIPEGHHLGRKDFSALWIEKAIRAGRVMGFITFLMLQRNRKILSQWMI